MIISQKYKVEWVKHIAEHVHAVCFQQILLEFPVYPFMFSFHSTLIPEGILNLEFNPPVFYIIMTCKM